MCCSFSCAFSLLGCSSDNAGSKDERDISNERFTVNSLCATDDLGRVISAKDMKEDGKYVGIWYSLWEGQHSGLQYEINNIQLLLDSGKEGQDKLADMSDAGQFYYWGKPLYGYYNMQDPWVLTRHIELFTMAGVDFLCIDATNRFDYLEVGEVLLGLLRKYKNQGFDVPKVMFYTNTMSGTTVNKIYKDYYKSGNWDDLWFAPNGRPMIVGYTENNGYASDMTKYNNQKDYVSEKMRTYFDLKESQWPNGEMNTQDGFPWMSWKCPQVNHSGYMAVPVAQHGHGSATSVSLMSPECSRGYNNYTGVVEGDWKEGLSFQNMWDNAIKNKDSVHTVLMCSWNEWMAQKQPGTGEFVDVYNHEYSRDIEMMEGGYNDNYYLQMMKNLREFSYTAKKSYVYDKLTVNSGMIDDEAWSSVKRVYRDFNGDAMARDFKDASGKNKYVDNSNRNDIVNIKVAYDDENVYFLVETADDITAYNGTDRNWMNLFISTNNSDPNFAMFNYLVNAAPNADGTTSVEKCLGGYNWQNAGNAQYVLNGNRMQITIPRAALGLNGKEVSFSFKVADNVTKYDDIADYYVSGDSAPIGRLAYSYASQE